MEKIKEHIHEYKAITYREQTPKIGHWDYQDHLITTVENEKVKIFCITCGSVKEI